MFGGCILLVVFGGEMVFSFWILDGMIEIVVYWVCGGDL